MLIFYIAAQNRNPGQEIVKHNGLVIGLISSSEPRGLTHEEVFISEPLPIDHLFQLRL